MTYMSCEAVTAGLVLTGLVHADPHEGNIMLADDGRLVFLDFGLMSNVDESIMEAFASGIQCVLSKDYVGLVQAFIDTGFVGSPIEWREKEADPWQLTHPDGDTTTVMAKELKERMEACPGGGSRFGALSIVLGDMGFFWQMYTPRLMPHLSSSPPSSSLHLFPPSTHPQHTHTLSLYPSQVHTAIRDPAHTYLPHPRGHRRPSRSRFQHLRSCIAVGRPACAVALNRVGRKDLALVDPHKRE